VGAQACWGIEQPVGAAKRLLQTRDPRSLGPKTLMGFPLEGVVSAEGHISEFICAICQLLAEYPVLTKCSNEHVFCQSCLDKWFKCKRSCPKCNGDLALPRAVRPLKEASPLAHRVLQRVKVKCPLSEQLGCAWQGDYGGVHAHLTNSEGHTGFDRTPPAASSSKQRQSSSQSSGPATDHHAGGMTWGDVGVQGNGVAPRQADPYHGTPGSGPSGVSASSSSAAASYLSSSSSQSSHPSSTSGSRDVMASIAALKREGDGKFELKQFKDAAALYTKALNVGTAAMRDDGGGGWGDGSDCGGDGGGDGSATASSGAASPAPPASSAAAGKEGEEGEREDADGDQVVVEDASDSESEGGGGAEGGGGGGAAETGPREEILGMPPSPPTLAPALSLPPPPPPPPPPTPPPSASSSAASGVSSGAPSTPSDLARLVAACYTNRAACELMLRNYRRCADDCGLAVALDPSFVRAHTRRAKALAELGEFKQAAAHLSQARTAQPSNRTPLAEEHKKVLGMAAALEDARAWCRAGDFKRARATTAALLQQTRASSVVLMAARAELGLGLTDRALRHTLTVLRAGGGQACESRPEACVLRGQAMLWGGSSGSGGSGGGGGSWAAAETQAAELAREALRLDPDHQEAKTLLKLLRRFSALHAAARADFNKREFATAVAKYVFTVVHVPWYSLKLVP